MHGWRREEGQAAAELAALLPLLAVVALLAWQLVVAGHALWAVGDAARAAARAAAVAGAEPRDVVRARLPRRLEHGLRVRAGDDGRVTVSARVPLVVGFPSLGRVGASARFAPQR